MLDFPVLAEYCLLPVGQHMIFCTHGHVFNEENLPPVMPGDSLLHGHTHVPRAERRKEIWILNPGSVSIPKDGYPPSYAVLEDGTFTVKRMDGTAFMSARIDEG